MRRAILPPFPCFCFAVFVLCIPMSHELVGPVAHDARPHPTIQPPHGGPRLERMQADSGPLLTPTGHLDLAVAPGLDRTPPRGAPRRYAARPGGLLARADSTTTAREVQLQ